MPTIGQLVHLACTWEVLARKAGNVCPGREFPDLTVNDFLASADAIAPILNDAPTQPLGVTILRAIEATRRVVGTNTNLGIVLLLAPLASVSPGEPLWPGVMRVLENTTVEDARNVYAAIRLAKPSGLGQVRAQDVSNEPTQTLRETMTLARERDLIANQYDDGFLFLRHQVVARLAKLSRQGPVERAIVETQLNALADARDSHIQRKQGSGEATAVRRRATVLVHDLGGLDTSEGRREFLDFDAWLRADNHARNPGTIADMIAAGLFVTLREGLIAPVAPFAWAEHPFGERER